MKIADLRRVLGRIVPCHARLAGVIDEPVLGNSAERTRKEGQEILHSLDASKDWKGSGDRSEACGPRNADKPGSSNDPLNRRQGSHTALRDRVRRITAKAAEETRRARRNGTAAAADGALRTAVTVLAAKAERVLADGQTHRVRPGLPRGRIVQQLQGLKTPGPDDLIRVEVHLPIS